MRSTNLIVYLVSYALVIYLCPSSHLYIIDQFEPIETKVKSALTRQYNELSNSTQALNYNAGVKKTRAKAGAGAGGDTYNEDGEDGDENGGEEEKEEEVTDLSAFQAKKKKPAAANKKAKTTAGTSASSSSSSSSSSNAAAKKKPVAKK